MPRPFILDYERDWLKNKKKEAKQKRLQQLQEQLQLQQQQQEQEKEQQQQQQQQKQQKVEEEQEEKQQQQQQQNSTGDINHSSSPNKDNSNVPAAGLSTEFHALNSHHIYAHVSRNYEISIDEKLEQMLAAEAVAKHELLDYHDFDEEHVKQIDHLKDFVDKHTKRKIDIHYIQGKKTAEENTEHLSKVLDKITFDARTHGVGSRGGHIARELKSPGPINGHSVVSDFDKFISPANFFPKHLPKMSFKPKKLDRPDWDEYFAAGNALALRKIVDDVPGKPSRTSNFRQEILKYRVGSAKKRLLSNSEPVIPTHQDLQQEKVEKPMNDLDMLLAEMDDIDNKQTDKKKKGKTEITSVAIGELGIDQPSEAPPVQKIAVRPRQPPELVNLAHQLWQTLIEELRASALAIDYKDILEISVFREPPEFIVVLVGYWCLLLGLKPTWHAAKSSLFLELMPLQNFLREVDPLNIPVRRLKKAVDFKATKVSLILPVSLKYKPARKVIRWISAFNKIAALMVSVDRRKREEEELEIALNQNAQLAVLESSVLSKTTEAQIREPAAKTEETVGNIDLIMEASNSRVDEEVLPMAESLATFVNEVAGDKGLLDGWSKSWIDPKDSRIIGRAFDSSSNAVEEEFDIEKYLQEQLQKQKQKPTHKQPQQKSSSPIRHGCRQRGRPKSHQTIRVANVKQSNRAKSAGKSSSPSRTKEVPQSTTNFENPPVPVMDDDEYYDECESVDSSMNKPGPRRVPGSSLLSLSSEDLAVSQEEGDRLYTILSTSNLEERLNALADSQNEDLPVNDESQNNGEGDKDRSESKDASDPFHGYYNKFLAEDSESQASEMSYQFLTNPAIVTANDQTISPLTIEAGRGTTFSPTDDYEDKFEVEEDAANSINKKKHNAEGRKAKRVAVEEEEAKRIADEEEKAKRIADEEVEAKRIADEEEKAKRIADEEEEAKRIADQEEEAKRKAAEEEEAKRIADEEESRRIADEEESRRIAAEEEEANRIADEEESRRIAEEEEARRVAADEEESRRIDTTGSNLDSERDLNITSVETISGKELSSPLNTTDAKENTIINETNEGGLSMGGSSNVFMNDDAEYADEFEDEPTELNKKATEDENPQEQGRNMIKTTSGKWIPVLSLPQSGTASKIRVNAGDSIGDDQSSEYDYGEEEFDVLSPKNTTEMLDVTNAGAEVKVENVETAPSWVTSNQYTEDEFEVISPKEGPTAIIMDTADQVVQTLAASIEDRNCNSNPAAPLIILAPTVSGDDYGDEEFDVASPTNDHTVNESIFVDEKLDKSVAKKEFADNKTDNADNPAIDSSAQDSDEYEDDEFDVHSLKELPVGLEARCVTAKEDLAAEVVTSSIGKVENSGPSEDKDDDYGEDEFDVVSGRQFGAADDSHSDRETNAITSSNHQQVETENKKVGNQTYADNADETSETIVDEGIEVCDGDIDRKSMDAVQQTVQNCSFADSRSAKDNLAIAETSENDKVESKAFDNVLEGLASDVLASGELLIQKKNAQEIISNEHPIGSPVVDAPVAARVEDEAHTVLRKESEGYDSEFEIVSSRENDNFEHQSIANINSNTGVVSSEEVIKAVVGVPQAQRGQENYHNDTCLSEKDHNLSGVKECENASLYAPDAVQDLNNSASDGPGYDDDEFDVVSKQDSVIKDTNRLFSEAHVEEATKMTIAVDNQQANGYESDEFDVLSPMEGSVVAPLETLKDSDSVRKATDAADMLSEQSSTSFGASGSYLNGLQFVESPEKSAIVIDADKVGIADDAKDTTLDQFLQIPNVSSIESDGQPLFSVGQKVVANYRQRGKFYPGVVMKFRGHAKYDIEYDDGEIEVKVSDDYIRPCLGTPTKKETTPSSVQKKTRTLFIVGSRVEGNYLGKGKWFPGSVIKERSDDRFDIQYDDGEVEVKVHRLNMRTILPTDELFEPSKHGQVHRIGASVEVNHRGLGEFSPATITRYRGQGVYDVEYSDDRKELRVGEAMIKATESDNVIGTDSLHNTLNNTSEGEIWRYNVGAEVEGNYRGLGEWHAAVVTRHRPGGLYDLKYEAWQLHEARVSSDMIRPRVQLK